MTEIVQLTCDPAAADPAGAGDLAAIDLTSAFQIASLLVTLDDLPVVAPHMDEAGA
jgi:hypothetical protein